MDACPRAGAPSAHRHPAAPRVSHHAEMMSLIRHPWYLAMWRRTLGHWRWWIAQEQRRPMPYSRLCSVPSRRTGEIARRGAPDPAAAVRSVGSATTARGGDSARERWRTRVAPLGRFWRLPPCFAPALPHQLTPSKAGTA